MKNFENSAGLPAQPLARLNSSQDDNKRRKNWFLRKCENLCESNVSKCVPSVTAKCGTFQDIIDLEVKCNKQIKMKSKTNLTFLLAFWACVGLSEANNLEVGACEPIKVDMCRQIGYNKTG